MRATLVPFAALIAFGGSLFSGFHFDDYGMLQDPAVRAPDGWRGCWSLLQTRPLTWFSFWVNYQVSGREPVLWHVVNVMLHMACAWLLYRLLERVAPKAALLGALLFAVHPIQSEAVNYVYARAILLCTLFCLLALDEWFRDRPWMAVLWFALAVLSKEECVTLPLVLLLMRRRKWPVAAMFAISLAAGIRVLYAIHATGVKNIGPTAGFTPLGYLSEQGLVILRYFGLLVFPFFFSVDPLIPVPAMFWRLAAWMVLLALIIAAAWTSRGTPRLAAAGWILVGLLLLIPSSSVFPVADLAADRRMYLPMIAFAPAIALLIPPAHPEKAVDRRAWVLACLLVVLAIGRTYIWASDERLWREAAAQAPGKVRPLLQLARAATPERALGILREAARSAPDDPQIPTELARVYLQMNRPAEALAEAGRALALAPGTAQALNNRGAVLLAMNQTAAARRDFFAALKVDPCLEDARENLERSGGIPPDAPSCGR